MESLKFKGTKGEWEVIEIDISDYKQICIANHKNNKVLTHIYLPEYIITEEIKANALLISKAPELLEMLNKLLPFVSSKEPNENKVLTNEIKQLIIQATELK